MARCATSIRLTPSDERVLRDWLEEARLEVKRAERARIILFAAEGHSTEWIAQQLGTRPARVSKWRTRFAKSGVDGLKDSRRSGKPARRDPVSDQRILDLLAAPAPSGRQNWTMPLLASAAGLEINCVRRILRARGMQIRRAPAAAPARLSDHRQIWIAGLMLSLPLQAVAIYSGPARPPGPAPLTESLADALEALTSRPPAFHATRFCRRAVLDHMSRLSNLALPGLVTVIYSSKEEPAGLPLLPNVVYSKISDTASWLEQAAAWLVVLSEARRGAEPAGANRLMGRIKDFLGQSDAAKDRCFEWFFTSKQTGSRRADAGKVFGGALAG